MKSEVSQAAGAAVTKAESTNNHIDTAQARVDDLRAFRQSIPSYSAPEDVRTVRELGRSASLPPEFIELGAMAIKNIPQHLGGVPNGEAIRDLMTFATSFEPVAAELETTAQVVRRSVAVARNKAGVAALVAYATLQRLAKTPEGAAYVSHVAHMARALGIRERKAKTKSIVAKVKAEITGSKAAEAKPAVVPVADKPQK